MRQITLMTTLLIALTCSNVFARGNQTYRHSKNQTARLVESKDSSRTGSRSRSRSPAYARSKAPKSAGYHRASMYLRKSSPARY